MIDALLIALYSREKSVTKVETKHRKDTVTRRAALLSHVGNQRYATSTATTWRLVHRRLRSAAHHRRLYRIRSELTSRRSKDAVSRDHRLETGSKLCGFDLIAMAPLQYLDAKPIINEAYRRYRIKKFLPQPSVGSLASMNNSKGNEAFLRAVANHATVQSDRRVSDIPGRE